MDGCSLPEYFLDASSNATCTEKPDLDFDKIVADVR
jgi:hypothetical protein